MNFSNTPDSLDMTKGFDKLSLGVFIYDTHTATTTYANDCFFEQHNLPHDQHQLNAYIAPLLQNKITSVQQSNRLYALHATDQGDGTLFVVSVDKTNELTKENEINHLKWKCSLTSLSNRRKLMKDIGEILDNKQPGNSLVVLNVDFFSRINIHYGYEYGNEFIIAIAEYLRAFQDSAKIYCLNGAEFALLLKQGDTTELIDTIKDRFSTPWNIRSLEQYTTISIGIIKIIDLSETPARILYKALHAVKEAKSIGSNKVAYYRDGSIDELIKNVQLEYYLRRSIMEKLDNFKVYYQPLVEAKTGNIVGFEALSRWDDSDLGFVLPSDYIGLAEYLGLIDIIDLHVLRTSAKFIKSLHDKGHFVKLSVNISAKQLYDDHLVDIIKEAISDSNLEFSYVNIEITESSAAANIDEANKKINALKEMGIGVHLDDFGSGYSSLNNLKDLAITTVKIDRKFIKDMHKTTYDYTFIETIIKLAHSANLKVCCEGVETRYDFEELRNLGADTLQGFYFARPLPDNQVLRILDKPFE